MTIKKDIEPLKSEISKLCNEINVEEEQVSAELDNLRIVKGKFDRLSGEVRLKKKF